MPRILPLDLSPPRSAESSVTFYTDSQLPDIMRSLPLGSRLYFRRAMGESVPSRIDWKLPGAVDRWYHLAPREAWGLREPAEWWDWGALRGYVSLSKGSRPPLTPGAFARRMVRYHLGEEETRQGYQWVQNHSREVAAIVLRWSRGGMQRLFRTYHAPMSGVGYYDVTAAYLSAMLSGPVPIGAGLLTDRRAHIERMDKGSTAWIVGAVLRRRDGYIPVLPSAVMGSAKGSEGCIYHPNAHSWTGPFQELLSALESGMVELIEPGTLLRFNSTHAFQRVAEALVGGGWTLKEAKPVYLRAWPALSSKGGMMGEVVHDLNDLILAEEANRDEGHSLRIERISGGNRLITHTHPKWPKIAMWPTSLSSQSWRQYASAQSIMARVRGEVIRALPYAEGLCQVFVDAIACESLAVPLSSEVGGWREEERAPEWRACAPGRYILGSRFKNAGSETIMTPEECRKGAKGLVVANPEGGHVWAVSSWTPDGHPIAEALWG